MRSTVDQTLLMLKTRGALRTGEVAETLGVTRQAARQQLDKLAEAGLVAHVVQRAGVGRPGRSWSLTEAGHARFPDAHAEMTVELIEAVREEFGEAGLERLIARRERAALAVYAERVAPHGALRAKVEALAAVRTAEGYMAQVETGDDGVLILAENHCPICAAARACQGFCRSELAVFRQTLGPGVEVERADHLLAGARRCAYRIRAL